MMPPEPRPKSKDLKPGVWLRATNGALFELVERTATGWTAHAENSGPYFIPDRWVDHKNSQWTVLPPEPPAEAQRCHHGRTVDETCDQCIHEEYAEEVEAAAAAAPGVEEPSLGDLAKQMRENSERWFPALHAETNPVPLRIFYALGMAGECGEVANVVKKQARGVAEVVASTNPAKEGIGAELADVFTYLLLLADECGVDLVAEYRAKVVVNEARWGRA